VLARAGVAHARATALVFPLRRQKAPPDLRGPAFGNIAPDRRFAVAFDGRLIGEGRPRRFEARFRTRGRFRRALGSGTLGFPSRSKPVSIRMLSCQ